MSARLTSHRRIEGISLIGGSPDRMGTARSERAAAGPSGRMWKYYIFKIAGPPFSLLPMMVGYIMAYIVAHAVYALAPGMRSAITDNMRHVIGWDADDRTLRRSVRRVLTNAAKNYFDFAKMPQLKLSDIERRVTVHGRDHLEKAISRDKGVILVTAHLGSFDMAGQILASMSVKTTVLIEAQEPQALLDHVTALRGANGISFAVARPGVVRTMRALLRRGEIVCLACDRDIARDGHKCVFFGEAVTVPIEAMRLAMRTGAAVVPAYNLRRSDNGYDVFFEPALEIATNGDDALSSNMKRLTATLEQFISTCPEQWVVLSPVWEDGYRRRTAAKHQCLVPS